MGTRHPFGRPPGDVQHSDDDDCTVCGQTERQTYGAHYCEGHNVRGLWRDCDAPYGHESAEQEAYDAGLAGKAWRSTRRVIGRLYGADLRTLYPADVLALRVAYQDGIAENRQRRAIRAQRGTVTA